MNTSNTTIAAIATPPGEGSIAIVRLSGPQAISLANQIFSGDVSSYASHTAHLGQVFNQQGDTIDSALLLVMKGPKSFTGEDVVEFQCHGGYFACSEILQTLLAIGAHPAKPGEFSQRAYLNGKIDLLQAEAIQNVIMANNKDAFRIAQTHLQGTFSKKIHEITTILIQALAYLEVMSDFPEEGEDFSIYDDSQSLLQQAHTYVQSLLDSFDEGRRLAQGIQIAIVGKPNAGKSSLLNTLTESNRAIVTNTPGTTRDLITSDWMLQGRLITLIDTAGQRSTEDEIEQLGIEKAKEAMSSAQCILWMVDVTQPPTTWDPIPNQPTFIVWNKIDKFPPSQTLRPTAPYNVHQAYISTKTGEGIPELKQTLAQWLQTYESGKSHSIFLVSTRHHHILKQICNHIEAAQHLQNSKSPTELIAFEVRSAIDATEMLSGAKITDNMLSQIFSKFCIGK